MKYAVQTNMLQNVLRVVLGTMMTLAAIAHFTFARAGFQAQVPNWVPVDKDLVVILSGIVELGLGLCMIFWTKEKVRIGIILAIFYVLVFPGNIAQYTNHISALHMDTDADRLHRLYFQPVLILWALWCTGALKYLFYRDKR
jgi:uncharacterized membrane protein